MAKRMLISATHPEETRVVVLTNNRLDEFDYETAARSQLKGNIYLAKITRVEPSLQAAFVEYGGNRHGFLPFTEIHPDYYRIPIADREALAAEEAALRGEEAIEENGEGPAEEDGVNGAEEAAETAARAPANPGERFNGADDEPQVEEIEVETRVDTVGGDEVDEQRRRRAKLLRRYKIQEVIKRRQVILVQVTKEERGTKGAALTTYLSLAGRYCVLMPNTGRGGGISRKIASANDRRRLKKILAELKIPEGMAVIVRTAGAQRTKAEIRRDYEYLMRLWDEIRETTLKSTAPCLIYEEANLIKRSIRDVYASDMDEVLIEGEDSYKAAKAFMRNLMPSHAKKVQHYKDATVPLFHKFQVESQLDAMHSPVVQLKSGGYIVLNQTEALVAIDVNSGKATRERHIEDTALKTNLEAAEEVARQLRLRDMAGLVVIDFIDMEESRHNREVERRLKEAMRSDRARIQLGRLSPFGLLELSRQRLRPSLFESSMEVCTRCGGIGHVRSAYSSALGVLRALEEEGMRGREGELRASVPTGVALRLLNDLRGRVSEIEERYGLRVRLDIDETLSANDYRIERPSAPREAEAPAKAAEEEAGRKRGGRRRGRRRKADGEAEAPERESAERETAEEEPQVPVAAEAAEDGAEAEEQKKARRRRGKRGGRRRSRRRTEEQAASSASEAGPSAQPEAEPQPCGPAAGDHDGEEQGEAAKPAAKSRGRRRRKAAEAPPAAQGDDADGTVEADGAGEVDGSGEARSVAPTEGEKPPVARKTPRRARKTAGESRDESEPGVAAGSGASEARPGEVAEPGESRSEVPVPAKAPAPDVPEPHAATAQEAPPGPPPEGEADRPKRRGWWQRWA